MVWHIPKSPEEAVRALKETISLEDIEVLKDTYWWLTGYVARGGPKSKPGKLDVKTLEKAIKVLSGILKSGGGAELREKREPE